MRWLLVPRFAHIISPGNNHRKRFFRETLYHKDLSGDSQFRVLERSSTTPTFCVWVLGAVWYEQQAWTRYLYSERDDAAKYAYVQDQMTGLV